MKTNEIRTSYIEYFKSKDHKHVPSDLLQPRNDPSLLFTGAGMNQFKEQFAGKDITFKRATTYQKCLRTGDLSNVGKTKSHHTFFEMLGNFSFGDYFKRDAIFMAWEYLVDVLRLAEKDLTITVYTDDDEAYDIWHNEVKVPASRIERMGDEDNFWPANARKNGPNGPCGPCSEIYYKGTEIWNLVFTQFLRKDDGQLDALPSKNIDTGMGLERLARVLQGVETNFDIDIFQNIKESLRRDVDLDKSLENTIIDHTRAAVFCIGDNILPGNEGRNYVVRKLIRRAYLIGRNSSRFNAFLYKLTPAITVAMQEAYPELKKKRDDIARIIQKEENAFEARFEEFQPLFANEIDKMKKEKKNQLKASFVFYGYDTCGVPVDLQIELAQKEGLTVDTAAVNELIEKQKAKSRQGSNIAEDIFSKDDIDLANRIKSIRVDESSTSEEGYRIAAIFKKEKNEKRDCIRELVVTTPRPDHFYCEGGGQVGDTGFIINGRKKMRILNTIQFSDHVVFDIERRDEVDLNEGDVVTLKLDSERKSLTAKNHTATHLLHYALRATLGEHITQAGSLVAPDRLRFDFTHHQKVTLDEQKEIERIINQSILSKDPVERYQNLNIEEAQRMGAMSLFGEKYADRVTVVDVGGYSKEFCGGTHVRNANEIEYFKITSESAVASGVRRIEARTGDAAKKWIINDLEQIISSVNELRGRLALSDIEPRDLKKTFSKTTCIEMENMYYQIKQELIRNTEDLEKKVKIKKKQHTLNQVQELKNEVDKLINKAELVGDIKLICEKFSGVDITGLRKLKDMIKNKSNCQTAVFFTGEDYHGKTDLLLWFSDDLVRNNKNAGNVIREIAGQFSARGGGKPDMAQAGLKEKIDLNEVIKTAQNILQEELA